MTIRTTVRLPEELMIKAKRFAAREGRSLTDIIEAGVRREIGRPNQKDPAGFRALPVSKTAGECLFPTTSLAELLDYLEEGVPLEKLR